MVQNASRDQNDVPTLLGTSNTDGTPVTIYADPVSHRLLVDLAGGGTVTSVSVVSANGFAGSVATATTTPAITLSTTITGLLYGNGTAISAALTNPAADVLLGWDNTDGAYKAITIGSGLTYTHATHTLSAPSGGITIGTTTISSGTTTRILYDNAGVVGEYTITGTGTVVAMQTSPSFTTPTLGVATATSINKVAITAPATSATLTIADGKTLTSSNTLTLAGTDSTTMTFGALSGQVPVATEVMYDYSIYKTGSTYVAVKVSDGSTVSSGSTADVVIQAVLDLLTSGGNVLIKDATYTITAPLLIKGANTRIYGQGKNTILSFNGASVSPLISNNSSGYNNQIIDSIVMSNSSGSTGTALKVNDANFCVYRNLIIDGGAIGIDMFRTNSGTATFYNSFYDINIGLSSNTITCINIASSGSPVNHNIFHRIRTVPGTNGYGVRIQGASNGNAFFGFDCEPASVNGQKGVSIEAASYANVFTGSYIEGNATGVNVASGCFDNSFWGGVIDVNTADFADAGYQNTYAAISSTSGTFTNTYPVTTTFSDNVSGGKTLTIKDNTTFAHTTGIFTKVQLVNGSDTSIALQIANSGTGHSLSINNGSSEVAFISQAGVPQFPTIELGAASDTTLARVSAGVISVEGVTVPTISSTNTLTNKRITKRTVTTTQSATPTINTDNTDVAYITGLAQAITSMTTNLSGTPVANDTLIISITDDGTARGITWGTSFESSGNVTLPTTTVISTRLDVGFLWNVATSKWRCVAVA